MSDVPSVDYGSESDEWRVIFKNGKSNVRARHVSRSCWMSLRSLDTGLLSLSWPYLVGIISLTFILSWLLFSALWWVVLSEHGVVISDISALQSHMYDGVCVENVKNLVDIFLFSIETQQSIGYGLRVAYNTKCIEIFVLLCIQGFFGFLIDVFFMEIVFKKMTQGRLETQSLLFSKNAVICKRPHGLALMFRIGDTRNSYIITPTIQALLLRIVMKGNKLTTHFSKLSIGFDRVGPDLFLVWPVRLVHEINKKSPLYDLSADDLHSTRFEIVIAVKGIVSSTGLGMRARTSYTNDEIIWGQCLEPMVAYNERRKSFEADFAKFHSTFVVHTPRESVRELEKHNLVKNSERDSETGM